jgi:hypothetical protein
LALVAKGPASAELGLMFAFWLLWEDEKGRSGRGTGSSAWPSVFVYVVRLMVRVPSKGVPCPVLLLPCKCGTFKSGIIEFDSVGLLSYWVNVEKEKAGC